MLDFSEWILTESLDLVPVNEPKLNKTKIIDLIIQALSKKNAPNEFIDKTVNHFNSLDRLFGHNKIIDGVNLLVYYYYGHNGFELHFVDLDRIERTGDEVGSTKDSRNIFSYVISVLFKYVNDFKAIMISAPPNNEKRLNFYVSMAKYIIKKYDMDLVVYTQGNLIGFQRKHLKEGINPFLISNNT